MLIRRRRRLIVIVMHLEVLDEETNAGRSDVNVD